MYDMLEVNPRKGRSRCLRTVAFGKEHEFVASVEHFKSVKLINKFSTKMRRIHVELNLPLR